ncbi:hypothetical protein D7V97_31815 [Corallococcus sp. CA053C]|uniref:hypothetical protein n=1 Tax=Corallococcus sp. CA053C TaxID=2316732 RepID=UPI000EA0A694|nr:hypothetical protein [Corallococcus sp. CA053C]RKG99323.1 hypothetical protein D7V97_31815 [Corallococcus sp. CA053C]
MRKLLDEAGVKSADKALAALMQLRDAGRGALALLFAHARMDVRVTAAAFLLRHRTAEVKVVVEPWLIEKEFE